MRIALDYDTAYAADPGLWDAFIDDAKSRGHEVHCIAQREVSDTVAVSASPAMLIHYIGNQKKMMYAQREGLVINLWIEGLPTQLY